MTTVAERAVDAAMEVEAKKDSLRQNQDGTWKLVLTVAPDGLPDPIMKAPPGVRYRVFFVEVGDNEEPIKHAPAASDKPRKPFKDYSLSQQAGMRCQDMKFHEFIASAFSWKIYSTDEAANFVRVHCGGIKSRTELETDQLAAACWRDLNAEYEQWAGLSAEVR